MTRKTKLKRKSHFFIDQELESQFTGRKTNVETKLKIQHATPKITWFKISLNNPGINTNFFPVKRSIPL